MRSVRWMCVWGILFVLAGCNSVGPRAVKGARLNYNDAIARTWNEQLLLNLVRLKYRDTVVFLEISSVTTSYSMSYSGGVSGAFSPLDSTTKSRSASSGSNASRSRSNVTGTDENYGANFGIGFEENPTISYTPLQGEQFVTQILSAIPLNAVALLSQSGWSLERIFGMCVQRMNGLENAASASGPTPSYAPTYLDFQRTAGLMRELQLRGGLGWYVRDVDGAPQLTLQFSEPATEAKEMLGLPQSRNEFVLSQGAGPGATAEIAVQTRSLLGVFQYLSNAVDAPARHVERGLVTRTKYDDGRDFDWSEAVGNLLAVRVSEGRPENAFTAVRYRGYWFYIEDADLNSKSTFGLLTYLFYLQAGEIESLGPALTLQVGR